MQDTWASGPRRARCSRSGANMLCNRVVIEVEAVAVAAAVVAVAVAVGSGSGSGRGGGSRSSIVVGTAAAAVVAVVVAVMVVRSNTGPETFASARPEGLNSQKNSSPTEGLRELCWTSGRQRIWRPPLSGPETPVRLIHGLVM